jgi:hypothetical protein
MHSERLGWERKHVANASPGLDDTRRARVGLQLAAQPQDLHVDAAVEHVLVHAGRLQKALTGERSLRRVDEGGQQRVFALRQRDRGTVGIGQPPRAPIELPAAEPAAAALRIPLRDEASGMIRQRQSRVPFDRPQTSAILPSKRTSSRASSSSTG